MKKKSVWAVLFWGVLLFLAGCSVEKTDQTKIRDIEFNLVEDSQMPKELVAAIEEKKEKSYKFTLDSGDTKYIVVGYGVQETGGYSISVEELYETRNAVYISTNLIGPAKGEEVNQAKSYPYIVLKIKYTDKRVVFE